jgi:hypothetical protein
MNSTVSGHTYLCSELVSIACEHSSLVPGNLEAIGQWSALVLTETFVGRNSDVTILTKDHVLEGVVERCDFDEPLGCYVEIRLKPESRWSEAWFRPQHMFALQQRIDGVRNALCKTDP